MRSPSLDPTAGERARAMRLRPGAAHRITDPTDPRYGRLPLQAPYDADPEGRVLDPTDPACARRSG
jgi:hypothetical protein